jgi:hypothetical protein
MNLFNYFFSSTGYMMPSGKIIVNDEVKSKMWPVPNLRLYPEFSLGGYKTTKGLTKLFIEE